MKSDIFLEISTVVQEKYNVGRTHCPSENWDAIIMGSQPFLSKEGGKKKKRKDSLSFDIVCPGYSIASFLGVFLGRNEEI